MYSSNTLPKVAATQHWHVILSHSRCSGLQSIAFIHLMLETDLRAFRPVVGPFNTLTICVLFPARPDNNPSKSEWRNWLAVRDMQFVEGEIEAIP